MGCSDNPHAPAQLDYLQLDAAANDGRARPINESAFRNPFLLRIRSGQERKPE
jgi:hypothetical protein